MAEIRVQKWRQNIRMGPRQNSCYHAIVILFLLSITGTMTIGKVKGLLYRLFKVDSSDQKLSSVDSKVSLF